MSAPPSRGLMPLTASLLPNVGAALQKRAHRPALPESTAVNEAAPGSVVFEPPDEESTVETQAAQAVRARLSEARRAQEDGPRSYTLGQIVEMLRERKARARRMVESGDPDGPEVLPRGTIIAQALKAMQ